MSVETITTISPVTNKPVVERQGPTDAQFAELPKTAQKAFLKHRKTTLEERKKIVKKALDILSEREDELAREITEQMGRPIAYTAKEVSTAVARGHYLLKICDKAFEDTPGEPEEGFKRYVKKVPLGPVLIIVPWNVSICLGIIEILYFVTNQQHSTPTLLSSTLSSRLSSLATASLSSPHPRLRSSSSKCKRLSSTPAWTRISSRSSTAATSAKWRS
jgi:hypothetical protein